MNTKDKTKNAIPYVVTLRVFNIVVSLLGMVLLVRYLNVKEYAIYAILMALPILLSTIFSFGYTQYILRYFPSIKEKRRIAEKFWAILLRRIFILSCISFLLIVLFKFYSERFGLIGYYEHFIVFQIIVLAQFSENFIFTLLNAKFYQKYILYLTIFQQLSRTLMIYIGIQLDKELLFFIVAFAIIWIAKFVISSFLILNKFGLPPIKINDIFKKIKEDKEERSYRRISYINAFGISFLQTDIDRYILAYFSTNIQVAIYALATTTLKKIGSFIPHVMFKQLISPAFFGKYDESNNDKILNKMFRFIINIDLTFTILYLGIFIPLGKELLQFVFKQNYVVEAYTTMIICICFLIFNAVQPGIVTLSIKKPQILLISKISSLVNIGLGIILAIKYGAWGMALATVISGTLKNIIIFLLTLKYVKISIPWISMLKWLFNTTFLVCVIFLFSSIFKMHLLFYILVGIIFYLIIIRINPILNQDEKELFYSLIPEKLVKYVKIIY